MLGHAVRDVVEQLVEARSYRTAFWPAQADPCLQAADYVTWAIQRKHEAGGTLLERRGRRRPGASQGGGGR